MHDSPMNIILFVSEIRQIYFEGFLASLWGIIVGVLHRFMMLVRLQKSVMESLSGVEALFLFRVEESFF